MLPRFLKLFLMCLSGFLGMAPATSQTALSLAELQDRIAHILTDFHVPGAGIALVHKDSVIWAGTVGLCDVQQQKTGTASTLYRMGSITKTFVGIGIQKLVEQGKLSLQTQVKDIAPEITFENPWEATHPVRVVHLLEHTSGLDDMHFSDFYTDRSTSDIPLIQAFAIHASTRKVRWPPGTRMAYSNPGYGLAGYIIEKCSGMRFEDFLKKEVLLPLHMPASTFRTDAAVLPQVSRGYHLFDGTPQEVPYREIYFRPAGSLLSSPAEMAHLVQFFLNRGSYAGNSILTPAHVDRMQAPQSTLAAAAGLKAGYGLGVGLRLTDSVAAYGHKGGIDGFYSMYQYIPASGVGYVIMLNAYNVLNADVSEGCMTAIQKVILQYFSPGLQGMPPPEVTLPAAQLEKYVGYYAFKSPRIQLLSVVNYLLNGKHVFMRNGVLLVNGWIGKPYPLAAVRPQGFRMRTEAGESTVFFTSPEGKQAMSIYSDYYEKESAFWHRLLLYSFLGALLCIGSAIVFAASWLIRHQRARWRTRTLYGQWLLIGASLCLCGTVGALASVRVFAQLMTTSVPAVGFFLGTILFAVCTVAGSFFTFQTLRQRRFPVRIYLSLLAVSCLGMLFFLSYTHLIGFRSWAW